MKRQLGTIIDLGGRKISDLSLNEFFQVQKQMFHHGVICIRNQKMDLAHEFLSSIFKLGHAIKLPPQFCLNHEQPNIPQLCRIGNIRPDGTKVSMFKGAEFWHQDGDYWGYPGNFIVNWLLSDIVPNKGGETGFIDIQKGLQRLDKNLQNKLRKAQWTISVREISDFEGAVPSDYGLPEKYVHQAVYKHQLTDQEHLYIGHYNSKLICEDGEVIETKQIIDELLKQEDLLYFHKYQKDDLVIFDNTTSIHKSMGGYGDEPRLLYRGQSLITPFHMDLYKIINKEI
ncbi:hypothetical protein pb186bvf_003281 [Paramecium bursaria]